MNYYIGDLHFGHANVIRHDGRPFADVGEMDRVMIERRNAAVGEDDDVYVVGDFCYRSGRTADWYLARLAGRKHLIVGNHDWLTLGNPKAPERGGGVERIRPRSLRPARRKQPRAQRRLTAPSGPLGGMAGKRQKTRK